MDNTELQIIQRFDSDKIEYIKDGILIAKL
jgi:hypothetical protein